MAHAQRKKARRSARQDRLRQPPRDRLFAEADEQIDSAHGRSSVPFHDRLLREITPMPRGRLFMKSSGYAFIAVRTEKHSNSLTSSPKGDGPRAGERIPNS